MLFLIIKTLCVDPAYYRPTEVDLLIGDASKAKKELNWNPKYDLKGLIKEMIDSELKSLKRRKLI